MASAISPECRSNQGPVKESDTIVNYNFDQLEDLTGIVISMPEVPKSISSSSNPLFTFQLEAKTNSDSFEGLFILVNSRSQSTNPGKLTLESTPSDVKKNLRQLKCNRPSDALRHKGANKRDGTNSAISSMTFNWIGNCELDSEKDIEFKIFIAKKIFTSSNNNVDFQNEWIATKMTCDDISNFLPRVNLKSGLLQPNFGDGKGHFSMNGRINHSRGIAYAENDVQLKNAIEPEFTKEDKKQKKDKFRSQKGLVALKIGDKTGSSSSIEAEHFWENWGSWSGCSKNCGYGQMSRKRSCIKKSYNRVTGGSKQEIVGSHQCFGKSHESTQCIMKQCSTWSAWYAWSICSKSCGGGEKSRKRICLYGSDCQGMHEETTKCNTQTCQQTAKVQLKSTSFSAAAAKTEKYGEEEGICENRYKFCNHWKSKGYCEKRFTKWMGNNCPLACDKCQVKTENCTDRYPISCPRWKDQNRCQHPDVFLREYIKRNCKLSCDLC